jgi:hypothetical protein
VYVSGYNPEALLYTLCIEYTLKNGFKYINFREILKVFSNPFFGSNYSQLYKDPLEWSHFSEIYISEIKYFEKVDLINLLSYKMTEHDILLDFIPELAEIPINRNWQIGKILISVDQIRKYSSDFFVFGDEENDYRKSPNFYEDFRCIFDNFLSELTWKEDVEEIFKYFVQHFKNVVHKHKRKKDFLMVIENLEVEAKPFFQRVLRAQPNLEIDLEDLENMNKYLDSLPELKKFFPENFKEFIFMLNSLDPEDPEIFKQITKLPMI